MLNRIFVREECNCEYDLIKTRFKIGVMGMGEVVGTSFVATAIAKELSKDKDKHVAYVEVNTQRKKAFVYDSIGMDKRFAGREFIDFHEEIKAGKNIAGRVNLDERINWGLCVPQNVNSQRKDEFKTMENIDLCRLINNITGNMIICDITYDEKIEDILKDMDVIVFVIDPLPSKLINNYDMLCEIKKYQIEGQNILWVVNKYNEGISKREFSEFMKIKQFIKIPIVCQSEIYACEYNCQLPYSVKSINEVMTDSIKQIVHTLNIPL